MSTGVAEAAHRRSGMNRAAAAAAPNVGSGSRHVSCSYVIILTVLVLSGFVRLISVPWNALVVPRSGCDCCKLNCKGIFFVLCQESLLLTSTTTVTSYRQNRTKKGDGCFVVESQHCIFLSAFVSLTPIWI